MKNYSYPFLFFITLVSLGAIFLFIWWKATIYRVTFLNPVTSRYLILSSLAVSLIISLLVVSKGVLEDGKLSDYFKLFAAISIVMMLFSMMPVMTIAYMLPGNFSSYTAPYTYASGSSKSCSGADVDDPDLGTNIRICYPYGNYENGNEIYIEKRSNFLGAVVTYSTTARHDFD